jgi:serine phosphatase RsbU (regulator of sigma subunit)
MNEWVILNGGDIFLLYTDGLAEHSNRGEEYFPQRLEHKIREIKHRSAAEIFAGIVDDMRAFGEPSDDISLVVIKRM